MKSIIQEVWKDINGKFVGFRVCIARKGICKTFKNLPDAIEYKKGVV